MTLHAVNALVKYTIDIDSAALLQYAELHTAALRDTMI